MDLAPYTSPGRDQFDRKYPVRIQFNDGKVVYGNIKSSKSNNQNGQTVTTNIHLVLIGSIDDWINNIVEENRQTIIFDDDVIDEISVFKKY